MAIGVGFNNCHDLCGFGCDSADFSDVMSEGIKVDFCPNRPYGWPIIHVFIMAVPAIIVCPDWTFFKLVESYFMRYVHWPGVNYPE
jgi:hypothetical protein